MDNEELKEPAERQYLAAMREDIQKMSGKKATATLGV